MVLSNFKQNQFMATFKPVVFTTKNHIKSDGTTNIKIRVYHNKESQYIPTPYYIDPKLMCDDGNISTTYIDADVLNFELGELIQKYRGIDIKLGKCRSMLMSCIEMKEYIISASETDYEFIDFIAFCNNLISETKKEKTKEWYQTSLNSFVWFINKKKIDARDITAERIEKYKKTIEIASQNGRPMENGGLSNYLRGLRAMYNKCKKAYNKEDYGIIRIPNKPFPDGIVPAYKRKRKNISVEDIKRIRDYQPQLKRTEIARDTFMIMFYLMGINVNDLYNLQQPQKDNRVVYERSKTNTDENIYNFPLSIRVEPELKELIHKYSEKSFLSVIKNRYNCVENFMRAVNKGLDIISDELNLPKITTNWARHSWASIARNKAKIPKADIDFCLGHVNNDYKMADIYIDIDYGIYDDANRKVLDLLK